ncbi:MAG: response regulator transcription factor [Mariprofundaceae bacterium]
MSSPQTYSVLLLEDEKPTREHLASLVNHHPQLTLFGEASCCADAYNLLQQGSPDVLLADIGLPDGSGVDVIRESREKHPGMEAMVLTVFGDEESVVAALEAGATGYLLKEQAFENLGESIIALMRGESAISPKVARFLLKRFTPAAAEEVEKQESSKREASDVHLTDRECEVLDLIAKGYSYIEIGESLSLSTNTIRAHIRNIYRKLAVRSRSEAVFEAAQLGIIHFESGH